jgi:hypothetical protein
MYAPPNPVGNVKRPVSSERKYVVCGDRLCATGALQHKQLGQNRNALEPDAECPKHFRGNVLVGEHDGEHCGASQEVFDLEGILIRVVCGLVVVEHQVDDVGLGGDEDDLKSSVPEGVGGVCP